MNISEMAIDYAEKLTACGLYRTVARQGNKSV